MSRTLPSYFISHGGGPWPWIPAMRQALINLERSLQDMVRDLGDKPKAVLMISGHWEAESYKVMGAARPPMVYDYYGFPEETYSLVYPAPGDPVLAQRVAELLQAAGLPSAIDTEQGFDHGTFVPMAIMYPEADVPLIQLSMRASYDPAEHMAVGRALAPLRDEGVLIVGSGLSYHNLRLFGPGAKEPSAAFDAWLDQALALEPEARSQAMLDWEAAPYARVCHAQEDHLVPLFVALGAAEQARAVRIYHDVDLFGGVTASSYRFDG